MYLIFGFDNAMLARLHSNSMQAREPNVYGNESRSRLARPQE